METVMYIIVGILLLIVILGLIAPKSYEVSRSIIINKPLSEPYRQAISLRKTPPAIILKKKNLFINCLVIFIGQAKKSPPLAAPPFLVYDHSWYKRIAVLDRCLG